MVFGSRATATLSGSQLAINGFGVGGDTVLPGAGISISESGGVETVTNTAQAPTVILDGAPDVHDELGFQRLRDDYL